MIEGQPMKRKEIISEYPIKEEENLGHIEKHMVPSEGTKMQHDVIFGTITDEQRPT